MAVESPAARRAGAVPRASEPEASGKHGERAGGRGAAWTEERGTSDEGRRCLKGARRRAGSTVSEPEGAAPPGLRSEGRVTREGGASKAPGGEREAQPPRRMPSPRTAVIAAAAYVIAIIFLL